MESLFLMDIGFNILDILPLIGIGGAITGFASASSSSKINHN